MRLAQYGSLSLLIVLLSAFGCSTSSTGDNNPPPGPTVPTFNATRAFTDLETQVGFGPRNPGSAGHDACRNFIAGRLDAAGAQVTQQAFTFNAATGADIDGTNLLGAFAGSARQGGALLIGAHWDTRPVADQDADPNNRDEPILGANDGASGVAVLLELARQFAARPPARPVILAFFDLEDLGNTALTAGEPLFGFSLGSRHFAANMGALRPSEAIVVDMVGDANLQIPQEGNSVAGGPELVDELWRRGNALGFAQFEQRQISGIIDDHVPLIQVGVPAVDLIDFDYPGPNSNRYWHTLDDTVDKCSPASLRAVGQTLLDYLYNPGTSRLGRAAGVRVARGAWDAEHGLHAHHATHR